MGSHFHDWIDYNGVAFSIGANRAARMGSHICGISGVSKFPQVGIWGIFVKVTNMGSIMGYKIDYNG